MGKQRVEESESSNENEETPPDPIPDPQPDPPAPTPEPHSLQQSVASDLNYVREQVGLSLSLVQDNMALLESKVAGMTEAQERGWRSVEHTLDQMKAVIELTTEFLTGMDERIDKLIGATAALIRVQQQLAAAMVRQNPDQYNDQQ